MTDYSLFCSGLTEGKLHWKEDSDFSQTHVQLITTILFDFGGTLASVYPSQDWLYVKACREFGVDGDSERLREADAGGWDDYMTPQGPAHPQISSSREVFVRFKNEVLVERLRQSGVSGPLEAIAGRIYELDTHPEMYRVYDDAAPALEALRSAGYRLAIISNHEWDLPDLVAGLGLAPYFDLVATSARSGYRKPHPLAYQYVIDHLKLDPREALMVGDDLQADVAGARHMGMQAAYIDRSGKQKTPQDVPLIHNLSELQRLL